MDIQSFVGQAGTIKWESPSNIALVKYWGKYGRQYPRNASISFTLNNAKSITSCKYEVLAEKQKEIIVDFKFEGKQNDAFAKKIMKFFASIEDVFPWIHQVKFEIESENTFPHSTGIASSASAMSALALCLCSINEKLGNKQQDFLQLASHVARLGSGSASRSVYPGLALWGEHDEIKNSSNDHAIAYGDKVAAIFQNYHDDILIVSKTEKSVSSTAGHALMESNPYAESRYKSANDNLSALLKHMEEGNVEQFIDIVEREALTLHAQMMCSSPSFILMEPNTLEMIKRIQSFRSETKVPVCFTLDAGPNIHLLYPDDFKNQVEVLIEDQLMELTENGSIIKDYVGQGPKNLSI